MAIDPNKFKIDPKKASQKDIEEALSLLEKKNLRKARVEAGELKGAAGVPYSELSPEQKKQRQKYTYRRMIRQSLLIKKAVAQGITVTDKEVDDELAKKKKK